MNPSLTIGDDFLDDPEKVRREVVAQGFRDYNYQNTPYYTVNVDYDQSDIRSKLAEMFKGEITIDVSAFRLGSQNSHLHNYVHADNTCAQLAAVLYLNKPEHCVGGTAFWKHKKYGFDSQPTQEQIDVAGITIEEWGEEWNKPEVWDMVTLAGMKTNRIIVYPSGMMHSRWPWAGFGDNPENSRLIWVCMFNLK